MTRREPVVLVEGESDAGAVRRLAERAGADVAVIAMGGATNIGHALAREDLRGRRLLGLCDEREERVYLAASRRSGVAVAVFVCRADLEDELIRALGVPAVEALIEGEGDLRRLRTLQRQPAQAGRPPDQQIRRFLGSGAGRKIRYAPLLVAALDADRLPRPLAALAAALRRA